MHLRKVTLIGLGVLTLSTSACAQVDGSASGTPGSAGTSPGSASVPSQPFTSPTTGADSPSPATVSDGCPVDGATLLAALKGSNIYSNLAQPVGLQSLSCYHGFATALTAPVAGTESSAVLFRYDATARSWSAINFGSSGICTATVPADIRAQLPQCAG